MAAKKKAKRKRRSTPPVSAYVEKRIDELAGEHGWDAQAVEKIVAGSPKRSRS